MSKIIDDSRHVIGHTATGVGIGDVSQVQCKELYVRRSRRMGTLLLLHSGPRRLIVFTLLAFFLVAILGSHNG